MHQAAGEGQGTSPGQQRDRGASEPLSPAALLAIAAAVEAAVSRAHAGAGSADAAAARAAATAVEERLSELAAEVRTLASTAPAPAQGHTVVVKKVKRYELGASISREKARHASPTGGVRRTT